MSAAGSGRVVSDGDGYSVDGGRYTVRPHADWPGRWEVVDSDGRQVGSGFTSAESALIELGVPA